jgi:vancomycin resistance protein VanJ
LFGLFFVSLLFFGQQFGHEIASEVGLMSRTISAEPEAQTRLRVLTLNVQAPNDDPTLLVGVIREHQPDLVVLQEVTTAYATAFDHAIGGEYPYSFTAGMETEHEGAGTWSRLPLTEPEAFRLSSWGNELHRVRISTATGDVWLYNVHLPNPTDPANADDDPGLLGVAWEFDPSRRDAELDALTQRIPGLEAPFIVAGDFNVSAGSRAYRSLPSSWRDAYAVSEGGFGPTYPAPDHEHEGEPSPWIMRRFALIRIDYVWASADLHATRAWTQELVDTDHLAVVADLTFSH